MIDPALEANHIQGEDLRTLAEQRFGVAVEKMLAPQRPAPWRAGVRHTGYHVELSFLGRANKDSNSAAQSKAFRTPILEAAPVGRALPTWPAGQVRFAEFLAEFPDVEPGPAARPST